jgi:DNA-binding transcriptional LysR family regulator
MQDLNDFYYFAEVVAHGGFAPAGRVLGLPKSKLSRRIAQLEDRLGVRLIERSSRRFRITDLGQALHDRCRGMLSEAEAAEALVAEARGEPRGPVRFSCPTAMTGLVTPLLCSYLARCPKVELEIVTATRAVDLISERIDVALRVRTTLGDDASLTMRSLGTSRRILVASPAIAAAIAPDAPVSSLAVLPTLSTSSLAGKETWHLLGPDGETYALRHKPRLSSANMVTLREASVAGLGVALLPAPVCDAALGAGSLVHAFPAWHARDGVVHLVFASRRGLAPAVRALVDHLARGFRDSALLA